jgi:hypothetical protein
VHDEAFGNSVALGCILDETGLGGVGQEGDVRASYHPRPLDVDLWVQSHQGPMRGHEHGFEVLCVLCVSKSCRSDLRDNGICRALYLPSIQRLYNVSTCESAGGPRRG